MSFRFRLERVLQFRQRRVDACGRDVAEAERAVMAAEARLAAVREEIKEHHVATIGHGQLVPLVLARATAWRDHLALRQRQAEAELARIGDDLAAARLALQEAWRDREVLVRLRERQQRQWRDEQARRHQKELDEVGSIRAAIAATAHEAGALPRIDDGKRAS